MARFARGSLLWAVAGAAGQSSKQLRKEEGKEVPRRDSRCLREDRDEGGPPLASHRVVGPRGLRVLVE